MTALERGYRAYHRGVPRNECPFVWDGWAYHEWVGGWDNAKKEAEGTWLDRALVEAAQEVEKWPQWKRDLEDAKRVQRSGEGA